MTGHRNRATRAAVVLWLLVLGADMAATGTTTMLVYTLVTLALAIVGVGAVAAHRARTCPQPVRVRADRRRHSS
jgi:hypothetical protein